MSETSQEENLWFVFQELYQERRAHLAELDKARAELLDVVTRADNQQLTSDEIHEEYEAVIDKLKVAKLFLCQIDMAAKC